MQNNCPSTVISLLIVVIYIVVVLHYRGKAQLYTGEIASSVVAMGGRAIWSEPPVLMMSDQAHEILEHAAWLQYLN